MVQRARGCLCDSLCVQQLVHQSKMGVVSINPSHQPLDVHQSSCMPLLQNADEKELRVPPRPGLACSQLTTWYMYYGEDASTCIQTMHNEVERSVMRNKTLCWCSANHNNHTGLSVLLRVWGVERILLFLHELISRSRRRRYLPLIMQIRAFNHSIDSILHWVFQYFSL